MTVSADKTAKVWDIQDSSKPSMVHEWKALKLGGLVCADGCPDAPFVVCAGGDRPQDNLRVMDIREAAAGTL